MLAPAVPDDPDRLLMRKGRLVHAPIFGGRRLIFSSQVIDLHQLKWSLTDPQRPNLSMIGLAQALCDM